MGGPMSCSSRFLLARLRVDQLGAAALLVVLAVILLVTVPIAANAVFAAASHSSAPPLVCSGAPDAPVACARILFGTPHRSFVSLVLLLSWAS